MTATIQVTPGVSQGISPQPTTTTPSDSSPGGGPQPTMSDSSRGAGPQRTTSSDSSPGVGPQHTTSSDTSPGAGPQPTTPSDALSGTGPQPPSPLHVSSPGTGTGSSTIVTTTPQTPQLTPSFSGIALSNSRIQPSVAFDMSVIDPALWSELSNPITGIPPTANPQSSPRVQASVPTIIDPNGPAGGVPAANAPLSSPEPSPLTTASPQPSSAESQQPSPNVSADKAVTGSKRKSGSDDKEVAPMPKAQGEVSGETGKENIPPLVITVSARPRSSPNRRHVRSSGRQRTAKVLGLPKTIAETKTSKAVGDDGSSSKRAKLS